MLTTKAVSPPVLPGLNPPRVFMSSNLCTCSSRCLESYSLFSWPTLTSSLKTQLKCHHLWKAEPPSLQFLPPLCFLISLSYCLCALCPCCLPSQFFSASTAGGQVYGGLQSRALEHCLLQSGRGRASGSVNSAGTVKGLRSTGPGGPACGVHQ